MVQRQKSSPSNGHVTPGYAHMTPLDSHHNNRHALHRLESTPVINANSAAPLGNIDRPAPVSRDRPDSLSGIFDDFTKMTQELAFMEGNMLTGMLNFDTVGYFCYSLVIALVVIIINIALVVLDFLEEGLQ